MAKVFFYQPPKIEPPYFNIISVALKESIPQYLLILNSDYYAKNVEKLGNEIKIEDYGDPNVLKTFVSILEGNIPEIPEEIKDKVNLLFTKFECSDGIRSIINKYTKPKPRVTQQKPIVHAPAVYIAKPNSKSGIQTPKQTIPLQPMPQFSATAQQTPKKSILSDFDSSDGVEYYWKT